MMSSRARVALLLLVVFAAGTAAGVAADRLNLMPGVAAADEGPDEGRRDRSGIAEGQTTIERFADQLGLTSGQRVEIEEILDGYRTSVRDMWTEVRPRYRSLMETARLQIEEVLSPEQVDHYRTLLEERYGGLDRDGRPRRWEDADEQDW